MPEFSIDKFIGANNDFARAYTFYVRFGGNSNAFGFDDGSSYLVKSSNLPASVITVAEVDWQGNKYKLGTTHDYTEWTVNFYSDEAAKLRSKFLVWSQHTHNITDNIHGETIFDYMADMFVDHVGHKDGQNIMSYHFAYAWPSNVGELVLDYSNKAIAEFPVTFTYTYFLTKDVDPGF